MLISSEQLRDRHGKPLARFQLGCRRATDDYNVQLNDGRTDDGWPVCGECTKAYGRP